MALLTIKPSPFALSWDAGTTVPITIYYNRLDGTIPSMAGGQIWVTFKNSFNDADPGVLQKTLSNGSVIITDAVNGVATAYMTPTESTITDLQKTYHMDVKVKESNGNEWVVGTGTLTLALPVTRTT